MRALKPHVKILGLTATLLAGVMLVSVGDAAAKGMGGMGGMHSSMGNGRSPALINTIHPIINKPGKSYGHHHDKDRKERQERKAERKHEHCQKTGTCPPKYVGKPIPGQPAPVGTKPVLAAPINTPINGPVVQIPSGPTPGKNPDPGYNGPPGSPPKGAGGNPNDPHGTGSTSLKQD
jgi:hypothetical protein